MKNCKKWLCFKGVCEASEHCRSRGKNASARKSRERAGAYSVEFAFCASILFVMVFALFEFSRYLYVRHAIDQAAYEAARVGIVPGASSAEIRTRAESLLNASGIANAEISIAPAVVDDTTREVTVEISCDFAENSFMPSMFIGGGDVTSRTTLDHENQAFLIPEDAAAAQALNENDEPQDV